MSHLRLRLCVVLGALLSLVGIADSFAASSTVVVSEFRVRGPLGGNDEFIELYNLSSAPIDISGWKIKGSNASGTTSTRATIPANRLLGSGCHYLLTNGTASTGYSGSVPGDQSYTTGVTDDGGIALTLPDDTFVDQLGMSAGSAFGEGTRLASLGSTNADRGYERKLGGAAGNGQDTDNNAADFGVVTPNDPQNVLSACVPPALSTGPSGVGAASPVAVDAGASSLLTTTVTPGTNPASTGLTVSADLSSIGGSATQAFADDGTGGDATAGDSVFSFTATVVLGTAPGAKTLPVSIADAQSRSASSSIALTVNAPPAGPSLVINEIDYDQPSTDTAEFLELKNVSGSAIDLDPYKVELVNGNGNVLYRTFELPSTLLAPGAYYVICANPVNTPNCNQDATPDVDLIQNGPPDGVRVVLGASTVDALSYEGDTGGSTEGSGAGLEDAGDQGLSRCQDGADTGQNNIDFRLRPITPGTTNSCPPPPPPPVEFGACGDNKETRIHVIQGPGASTPDPGLIRVVEGVVVGDFQGTGQFNGYFVQEEVADQDGSSLTSEGIFVFSGTVPGTGDPAVPIDNVSAGDVVRVRGTAGEAFGMTQLSSISALARCGPGSVPATPVSLPVADVGDHEAFEGMLVSYSQTLTATEVFNLGRFGEVSLSGAGRLYNTTAVAQPGAPALAVAAQNARSRIILDDASNTQNNDPTLYPQGGLSATNTLRVGDTLNSLTGVLEFRFSNYRIQPVGPVTFNNTNLRTPAPDAVGGNLRVASFNVLNFFNGDGLGGGFPTSRGANSQFELDRQRAKEVSALRAMNADIVGLMEIENDGGANSALAELVGALNAAMGAGTYAYIDTGVIGTDEIKVALIYKPGAVTPVGDWKIITSAVDPRFIDTRNRPSLAQTFRQNSSGQKLTVVVNHLKSKGSACAGDPDTGDGSGNCNLTRTAAAAALVDWLDTDPTGSGDPDFLLIGDMNSYTFEDPIATFESGGFTNLVRQFLGLTPYSYVFNGESGYLDHALATGSLAGQVTGVTDWHINPDEPTVLDYNVEFKTANQVNTFYDPGPYRSSDHDPVVIGIQFNSAPTADAGGPYTVGEGGSVNVAATGSDADGDPLAYAWDLDNDGDFDDATGQTVSFSAAAYDGPVTRTIRVRVSDAGSSTVDTATVQVTNVAPTATFNAPASTLAGSPFTLSLTNGSDAAPADVPTLQYAFDCGSGYGAFSASSTTSCPTDSTGTRSVGGKVRDDDGGVTEYRATVTVTVTYASLCALVQEYVDKGGVAQALCSKLEAAAAKADRTDQEADLHAFVNQVEAQSGKSMTAAEAAILVALAEAL